MSEDRRFNCSIEIKCVDAATGKLENHTLEETGNLSLSEVGEWVDAVYGPLLQAIPALNKRFLADDLTDG